MVNEYIIEYNSKMFFSYETKKHLKNFKIFKQETIQTEIMKHIFRKNLKVKINKNTIEDWNFNSKEFCLYFSLDNLTKEVESLNNLFREIIIEIIYNVSQEEIIRRMKNFYGKDYKKEGEKCYYYWFDNKTKQKRLYITHSKEELAELAPTSEDRVIKEQPTKKITPNRAQRRQKPLTQDEQARYLEKWEQEGKEKLTSEKQMTLEEFYNKKLKIDDL